MSINPTNNSQKTTFTNRALDEVFTKIFEECQIDDPTEQTLYTSTELSTQTPLNASEEPDELDAIYEEELDKLKMEGKTEIPSLSTNFTPSTSVPTPDQSYKKSQEVREKVRIEQIGIFMLKMTVDLYRQDPADIIKNMKISKQIEKYSEEIDSKNEMLIPVSSENQTKFVKIIIDKLEPTDQQALKEITMMALSQISSKSFNKQAALEKQKMVLDKLIEGGKATYLSIANEKKVVESENEIADRLKLLSKLGISSELSKTMAYHCDFRSVLETAILSFLSENEDLIPMLVRHIAKQSYTDNDMDQSNSIEDALAQLEKDLPEAKREALRKSYASHFTKHLKS